MSILWHNDLYQFTMAMASLYHEGESADPADYPHVVAETYFRGFKGAWTYAVMSGNVRIATLKQQALSCPSIPQEVLFPYNEQGQGYCREVEAALQTLFKHVKITTVKDGTYIFPNEPVVRVEGPLPVVQLLETPILSIVNHGVRQATKATRIVRAARGKPVLEFGCRRADPDAAMHSSAIAVHCGFHATSNVAANLAYKVPVAGTMAHSFVQAHGGPDFERAAFEAYAKVHGLDRTIFLVDTYDILRGTGNAIRAALSFDNPTQLKGVRVDSGEWPVILPQVRVLLDSMGFTQTKIFVSNDLDESSINAMHQKKVTMPNGKQLVLADLVDGYGVGTRYQQPVDVTNMGFVYKLVEVDGKPSAKASGSAAKRSIPFKKNIRRVLNDEGEMLYDVLISANADADQGLLNHNPTDSYYNRVDPSYFKPTEVLPAAIASRGYDVYIEEGLSREVDEFYEDNGFNND